MASQINDFNATQDSPAAAASNSVSAQEPSSEVTGAGAKELEPLSATSKPEDQEMPKSKKAPKAAQPTTVESVVSAVRKYVPGLNREPSEASKPKRNRPKKTKSEIKSAEDPALATATLETAPEKSDLPDSLTVNGNGSGINGSKRPAALTTGAANSITPEEQAVLDHKRFSPSALVQKRLKANGKKLQRITGYENQTETLNADQKKAVASKPALDAVQKELTELVKVLETEEADDDKKLEKKKQYEDKLVQIKVAQAVSNANINTQNDLTLLLQFLHLYSCFNPSQSFAPPTLPPVVANATAQQHAAVHSLFHNLANGPLFGGSSSFTSSTDNGDAMSQIKALQEGSNKDIIEGISFADIKQMILDLTAPPNELEGHEIPESSASNIGGSGLPGDDQQPPLAAAEGTGAPSFNFMQASELGNGAQPGLGNGIPLSPPTAADDAQHEKALETSAGESVPATPGFGSAIPTSGVQTPRVLEPVEGSASAQPSGWDAPSTLMPNGGAPAAGAGWGDDTQTSGPIKSWADDVDDANPINPFTTTAEVPSELSDKPASSSPAIVDDGFQSVGGNTDGRGRGRGGPRGGRGEHRGRGGRGGERGSGYRGGRGGGGSRGDGEMQWRRSDAVKPDAALQAIQAGEGAGEVVPGAPGTVEGETRRGGYRGGRGRGEGGEYRGRGRGAPRGGDGEFRGGRGRGEGRGSYRGGRGGAANTGGAPSTPAAE